MNPETKALFRLLRFPLGVTVMADLLGGAALSGHTPDLHLLPAFAASFFLYSAGMVLNDIADLKIDVIKRKDRPLPSKAIGKRSALLLAIALFFAGIALPWLFLPSHAALFWLYLASAVLLYDLGPRKSLAWGAPLMGACRAIDLLAGVVIYNSEIWINSVPAWASLYFLYGLFVTIQAQRETKKGNALQLIPLAPLALSFAFLPPLAMPPIIFLAGEILLRYWKRGSIKKSRQITGAWVRGFLLIGSALSLSSGNFIGACIQLVAWILLSLALRRSQQS